ncbi:MAG: isoleucine--tRNA ligase [Pseudomonadota bacterium]
MRGNLPKREPDRLAAWQAMDLHAAIRKHSAGRPKFILHDGPPYANGVIHMGHAVNKVLKDIIVKSRQVDGYDSPYIPGWDCHGLPIENKVEQEIGKPGKDVDVGAFRARCREYALGQIDAQRTEFKRLGILGDWDDPYLTMNFQNEADAVRALGRIIERGHVYKGVKPVYWSWGAHSALAEAEVEYQDKVSTAIDVRFAAVDAAALRAAFGVDGGAPLSVLIWTTTPWTLPGNLGVSVHPELDYALVSADLGLGPEQVVLAADMVAAAMQRYGVAEWQVEATAPGSAFDKMQLQHPFYARQSLIMLGEHVTLEAGTGAVHTAPDHGVDDFNVAREYGLELLEPVDDNGFFKERVELFGGEHVMKVDAHMLEVLRENKALVKAEDYPHSYPHCWRTKTPIIYRATPQWFISMDQQGLRDTALAEIAKVNWVPGWGRARIEGMIANRPDWCISRQRYWGIPIPLFVHKESGALHPETQAIIESVAGHIEQGGIQAWFDLASDQLIDDSGEYSRVTDVMDVWFDSGTTFFHVLQRRDNQTYPADMYLEGSDQHRGWFHSSLLASCAINGHAPYRQVLTHGFTVDEKGHKMSKSLGNSIEPQEIMKELGADIVRLWVASTDYSGEISLSREILKRNADAYRRIRNTARFLLGNLNGFDPSLHSVEPEAMLALDRWVLDRAAEVQQAIQADYTAYQFHQVVQKIHHFCAVDLGGFYLDIIKDRQYTTAENSRARRSAQTALFRVAETLVRWIAPILSFTADEIWEHLPGARSASVHLETWFTDLPPLDANNALSRDDWQRVLDVRMAVNRALEDARNAKQVGGSLDAELTLYADADTFAILERLGDELRFVTLTSTAVIAPLATAPDAAVQTELAGGALRVRVVASTHTKCVRCWHRRADVGVNLAHPGLCGRCVENVLGDGEVREFC